MEPNPKFCGSCGAHVTPDLRYCEQCGKPVRTSAPMDAQLPPAMGETLPISSELSREASIAGMRAPVAVAPPKARRPRRSVLRLLPGMLLLFLLAVVGIGFAGWFGFPLEARAMLAARGLRTTNEKSRVGAFPIDDDGTLPAFSRRRVRVSSPPAEAQLVTPAYDVRAAGDALAPFEISLPLLHASAIQEGRHIVMGHLGDDGWEALPTEAIEDRVWAVADSLGEFAAFSVPLTQSTSPGLIVHSPSVMYGRVRGEHISVHFDLRGSDVAYDRDEPFGTRTEVRSLRVEVSRPDVADGFAAYDVNGVALEWPTTERVGVLPISMAPLPRSLDHADTVATEGWLVRVVPVYADGSTGAATEPVTIFPLVLRSLVWLRRNLPLEGARRADFLRATQEHALGLVFTAYLDDSYNGAIGWSEHRLWGRRRAAIRHPHMGMRPTATYGETITHEWGHYAAHMVLGEAYYSAHRGEPREIGRAVTRSRAFSEDLATWLGQIGTGRGLPSAAGAMHGHLSDYSADLPGPGGADRWPSMRDVDAAAVEGVPATILGRIGEAIGAARLLTVLVDQTPEDAIALFHALEPDHRGLVQPIYIDEGVSFLVSGRVESQGQPVGGAIIRVRTLEGTLLPAASGDARGLTTVTDAQGRFTVRVPPGEVHLVAERSGLTLDRPVSFTAAIDGPTNGPAQPISVPITLHQ